MKTKVWTLLNGSPGSTEPHLPQVLDHIAHRLAGERSGEVAQRRRGALHQPRRARRILFGERLALINNLVGFDSLTVVISFA